MLCSTCDPLAAFRAEFYALCGARRDALFELMDALLTADPVPSPVHLSLALLYRRGWGSLYAALAQGEIPADAVEALLAAHPLAGGEAIYAVDTSVWPRCDAETSPDRGFYYHPSRHSAGQPIVAGWAYQWMAQLGFARDSWTAPLSVRRVHPTTNTNQAAAVQVKAVVDRRPADGHVPLFVFDAGYDPVGLAEGLAGVRVAILVRLRADRCFYADPLPYSGTATGHGGRPRRHGQKFACADETTWWAPTDEHTEDDPQYGRVRVRAWAGVHAKTHSHATRGTRRPRPIHRGTLIRVDVDHLPRPTRPPRPLWLWWQGPGTPDLAVVWRAYRHRFDLEHTLRFCKQTLGWTTPRVRHPQQADRWTWLVVLAYTQLRLARAVVADQRLPWERPLDTGRLSPYRVRRQFPQLRTLLGSPARPPKPCGRPVSRPKGRRYRPALRYEAIKLTKVTT